MAKAARRRAKKRAQAGAMGAPKRDNVVRYPGGRIDYKATETMAETMGTVKTARVRQLGVKVADAGDPLLGYALGRLYKAGALKAPKGSSVTAHDMLEAGNRMHNDIGRYYALTGLPYPSPRAMDPNRVVGLGGEPRQKAVTDASNRVMAIEMALGCADEQGRPVTTLTKRVVIEDMDTANWTPSMIGKVVKGLLALVDFYGVSTR